MHLPNRLPSKSPKYKFFLLGSPGTVGIGRIYTTEKTSRRHVSEPLPKRCESTGENLTSHNDLRVIIRLTDGPLRTIFNQGSHVPRARHFIIVNVTYMCPYLCYVTTSSR